jgi:cob(I)alamin adenosyltransferase
MPEYYTGSGDNGDTGIISSNRVSKGSAIIEAIGAVDELNSAIGVACCKVEEQSVKSELESIQNDLFIIGANLASLSNPSLDKAVLNEGAVKRLEESINRMSKELPDLKEFVLPGGSEGAASLHLARSTARRAERDLVKASEGYQIDDTARKYVNRLSSYLFVAALYANYKSGITEKHPKY